jgi:hypothetical protein
MARIDSKWPLLLVAGDPVTEEQADEILLRTTGYIGGNDKEWLRDVAWVLGIDTATSPPGLIWSFPGVDAWYESISGLELHYLENSRIISSYIGGPHGWCDWDGRIGASDYNIGKWPTTRAIEEDLTVIAAAFPYLTMRVQLVEEEGAGDLCGEWLVHNGTMMETEPGPRIPGPGLDVDKAVASLFRAGRERGVTLERLARARVTVETARERDKGGGSA